MAPDVLFNASLFCFPLRRPYSPQASLIIAMWFFFLFFPVASSICFFSLRFLGPYGSALVFLRNILYYRLRGTDFPANNTLPGRHRHMWADISRETIGNRAL